MIYVDTKVYSTEAKGGMASLGELANLKFGKSEDEETVEEKWKMNNTQNMTRKKTTKTTKKVMEKEEQEHDD